MMDADTRQLLVGSLRSMMADSNVNITAALDDLGWDEVLREDPAAATTLLFREQGRVLARSAALDRVVLDELGAVLPPTTGARAVLYPMPDAGTVATESGSHEGLLVADPSEVTELVIPVDPTSETGPVGVAIVPIVDADLAKVAGMDALGGWHRARVTVGSPDASTETATACSAAIAAARRGLAAELAGVSETVLQIAIEHTSTRVQYGRPIASYQSVRHRLAESHALVGATDTVLHGAWIDGSSWAAAAAKAQAGFTYVEVARHAMQVCGAIGLTQEHRLHRYVRHGAMLDALLGSFRELCRQLGRQLLDGLPPPAVIEL